MTTYTIFLTGEIENNVPFSKKYCCIPTEDLKKWINAEFAAVEVYRKKQREVDFDTPSMERIDRTSKIELNDDDLIKLIGKTYMRLDSESLEKIEDNVSEDIMEKYLLNEPVVVKISQNAEL